MTFARDLANKANDKSIVQVVNATTSSEISSATNTFVDTGLTATITPTSTNSKILVFAFLDSQKGNDAYMRTRLLRNSTELITVATQAGYTASATILNYGTSAVTYLDSPATTSAVTYKMQFRSQGNNSQVLVQASSGTSSITLMEVLG